MSFTSSASLMGASGRLRSWVMVVVKPFTSSPAMPITTWLGRKPAISSASWRATAQLSTTALMSATVPDCMWLRPWRLRPTPRTVPWPSSSISNTSAFANSVPMSSAVQAASAFRRRGSRCDRRKAIYRARLVGARHARDARTRLRVPSAGRRSSEWRGGCRGPYGRDRVAEPLTARTLALGHLRAAAALPSIVRHGLLDERRRRRCHARRGRR